MRITTAMAGSRVSGEVCPLGPTYLPSHAAGARAALREVISAVVGLNAANLGAVNAAMDGALMGHRYAKSAIDTASLGRAGKIRQASGVRAARRPPDRNIPALRRGATRLRRGDDRDGCAIAGERDSQVPAEDRRGSVRGRGPHYAASSSRLRSRRRRRRRRQRRLAAPGRRRGGTLARRPRASLLRASRARRWRNA